MQKKITAITLALILAFSMAVSAAAAQPRYNSVTNCNPPALSFSGTTATCKLTVTALSGSKITTTLTLYKVVGSGVSQVASWDLSGTTSLNQSKTCSVTKGQEYLLAADISVDGSGGKDSVYKTTRATCP